MAKKPQPWTWTAHAMREQPKSDAERVTLKAVGSRYDGEELYELSGSDGPPCMTAAEWRAFCVMAMGMGCPIRDNKTHDE